MTAIRPTSQERIGAATATALLVAALGYAFIAGLSVRLLPGVASEAMQVFDILPKPPPPKPKPIERNPVQSKQRAGAAAPPNLTSKPTALALPPPIAWTVPPPPVVVALTPGAGKEAMIGNAQIRGPGPGSGGIGNGTGSGDAGDGDGDGEFIRPHHLSGRLKDSDYHRRPDDMGIDRTVSVLFVVSTSGRVTDCEITHSSGDDALDDSTCRLIEQRFHYDPSRDAHGRPVESRIEEDHTWVAHEASGYPADQHEQF